MKDINNRVITFLEYYGAKLSKGHRKWAAKSSPFNTRGEFRPDGGRLTSIQSIPKCRQHDTSLNPKVEKMREGSSRMEILTPVDVKDICSKYHISDLTQEKPKQLSNTGIYIAFKPQLKCFCLTRDV